MIANRMDVDTVSYKKFDFGAEIGSGGFSKVFEVSSCLYSSKLALKCPERGESIRKEGRLLSELNKQEKKEDREYIIQFIAFVRLENRSFGLLAPLYQTTLSNFVKTTENGLSFEKTLRIAKQLLDVAAFLKKQKVIHRDIKPSNIFMEGEEIKLGDFGLAIKSSKRNIKNKSGTKLYLSPEIVSCDRTDRTPYGFPSDMWAIGCTIYFTLSKNHLFGWNSILRYLKLSCDQLGLTLGPNTLEERFSRISRQKYPEEMGVLKEILGGMLTFKAEKRLTSEAGLKLISRSESPKVIEIMDLAGAKRSREEDKITSEPKRIAREVDHT